MRRSSLVPKILVMTLAVLALAACGGGGNDEGGGGDETNSGADDITITLDEVAGSGQTGTATLAADGTVTNVLIVIEGGSSGTQPAHIHEGTCEQLNPEPAYGLNEVQNDFSDSTVEVPLDTLIAGEYAINLHVSPADLETYTSCGNIEG